MSALMLSCEKASALCDKQGLLPLSFAERVQLRMHTGICTACKNYREQSARINRLLKEQLAGTAPEEITNEALKLRLLKKLE